MFPWIRGPQTQPPPRYNIAPTQPVPAVLNEWQEGKAQLELVHWGLIPSWAKDPSIGGRMINARAESLAQKPAFRAAFKRRRCLIPASGFYEWKKNPDGKTKTPMYIRMKDGRPFAFAGLWEVWHSEDGSQIKSCAIITGEPNELVKPIHDRMPVILLPQRYRDWLDPNERPADELMSMLKPYPPEQMQAYPVSRMVNNPKNDSPKCIEPMPQVGPQLFER